LTTPRSIEKARTPRDKSAEMQKTSELKETIRYLQEENDLLKVEMKRKSQANARRLNILQKSLYDSVTAQNKIIGNSRVSTVSRSDLPTTANERNLTANDVSYMDQYSSI